MGQILKPHESENKLEHNHDILRLKPLTWRGGLVRISVENMFYPREKEAL